MTVKQAMSWFLYSLYFLLVNGNWGSWSKYFSCSVTCGEGTQTRRRLCDEPAPQYGGEECVGESAETQPCTAATTCLSKRPVNTNVRLLFSSIDLLTVTWQGQICWQFMTSWSSVVKDNQKNKTRKNKFGPLRLPHRNDAKIAKICNLRTFWLVIHLINHLFCPILNRWFIGWITSQDVQRLQIFAILDAFLWGNLKSEVQCT